MEISFQLQLSREKKEKNEEERGTADERKGPKNGEETCAAKRRARSASSPSPAPNTRKEEIQPFPDEESV